jgi:hypothetical protein
MYNLPGIVMSIEKSVIERLESFTPEQQGKLLEFLDSLEQATVLKGPRRSLRGLFADFGVTISKEDIEGARREMWGNFPRDIS